MTQLIQLTRQKSILGARIITTALIGLFLMIASSPASAQWTTGTNINNTNSGTVSVGTSNPGGDKLITAGNTLVGNITGHTAVYSTYDSQSNVIMELGYGTATSSDVPLASLVLSKNLTGTNNAIGAIQFANRNIADGSEKRLAAISNLTDGATNSGLLAFHTTSSGTLAERLRITSAGNVGIGTTTPTRALEVLAPGGDAMRLYRNSSNLGWGVNMAFAFNNSNGSKVDFAGVHGITEATTAGAEAGSLMLSTTSGGSLTERVRVTSAGNVGLGTTSPDVKLQINHASTNTNLANVGLADIGLGIRNTSSTNGNLSIISFRDAAGYGTAHIGAVQTDQTNHTSDLIFNTKGTGSFAERMRIRSDGNVGIGTAPTSKRLEVAGDLNASGAITGGTIQAKYQDVAEWVESSQLLPAGTVVVLDHSKSNQVIASSQAYDTRVAGVISAKPGITLGEEGETKVLVATTGRVKVKVDASAGPIQVGDLLVTSEIEGVAKKSEPLSLGGVQIHRPGTLIGKALEPLAKGSGEILVLLSLQ